MLISELGYGEKSMPIIQFTADLSSGSQTKNHLPDVKLTLSHRDFC